MEIESLWSDVPQQLIYDWYCMALKEEQLRVPLSERGVKFGEGLVKPNSRGTTYLGLLGAPLVEGYQWVSIFAGCGEAQVVREAKVSSKPN